MIPLSLPSLFIPVCRICAMPLIQLEITIVLLFFIFLFEPLVFPHGVGSDHSKPSYPISVQKISLKIELNMKLTLRLWSDLDNKEKSWIWWVEYRIRTYLIWNINIFMAMYPQRTLDIISSLKRVSSDSTSVCIIYSICMFQSTLRRSGVTLVEICGNWVTGKKTQHITAKMLRTHYQFIWE